MRTIFVIQHVEGKNLAPARDYGDINVVLGGRESTDVAVAKLSAAIQSMRADDYLLLIGHPINIAIASHLAFNKFPVVHFLVWDREHYRYNHQSICL